MAPPRPIRIAANRLITWARRAHLPKIGHLTGTMAQLRAFAEVTTSSSVVIPVGLPIMKR